MARRSSRRVSSAGDSPQTTNGSSSRRDAATTASSSRRSSTRATAEPDSSVAGDDASDIEVIEDVGEPELDSSPESSKEHYYLGDAHKSEECERTERHAAVTRFRYLLGLSDLFRHFVDLRAQRDPEFQAILDEAGAQVSRNRRKAGRASNGGRGRGRGASARRQANDEESDFFREDSAEAISVFTASPPFINGTLREYQIDGLNWLISLFNNSISGILADEMGLGKTFQTISFLSYLRSIRGINGPHLILVPKSTVDNWAREFAKWSPDISVLVLTGDKHQRAETIKQRLLPADFDVCITSFELVIREKSSMRKFAWQYIIVDEAHRIKNEDSILSKIVRMLHSNQRLLITGTPLQNNLHELWALLNFLLPDVFADSEVFDEWFQQENEDQDDAIRKLHMLLHPFLLRRVKSDVEHSLLPKKEINLYVGMTDMQIKWYQNLLEKDLDAVNGTSDKREGKMRLLNIVMQLRKCCNHPYLFEGAEPGPPYTTDEHIVENAGKMLILDKLLARIKEQGSRVLIFSQMSRMLDILEDYCGLRGYQYSRIDGSTAHEDRVAAIDEYNQPGSEKFVFLLTTRAGGLGINLTTADQVVIYDSDWNPQADLQAMDRAHRIGQTKQVMVYRFVTERAVEEKVLERAAQKLRLDQLVIQEGRGGNQDKSKSTATSKDDLVDMIRHGAQSVIDQKSGTFVDDNIDNIIKQGEERTRTLNHKFSDLGLDDLQKFTFDHPTPIVRRAESVAEDYMPRRRERKEMVYTMDNKYVAKEKIRTTRPPRRIPLLDFQFFPAELERLQEKEMAYYRKQMGVRVSAEDFSDEDEETCADMNNEIENAEPLTEEELARKEELIAQTFLSFSKRDFHHFISLLIKYGRNDVDSIIAEWKDKSEDEIRRYHKVFFERYEEVQDHERYMAQIEAGETRVKKQQHQLDILQNKIKSYAAPLSDMQISYPLSNAKKSYSEDEDRFLLVMMNELGLDTPNLHDKIRDRIRSCGLFDFDWFFLSRTPVEISRRCSTLLLLITREVDGPNAMKRQRRNLASGSINESSDDEEPAPRGKRSRDDTPIEV